MQTLNCAAPLPQLPLSLLNAAKGKPILVELKNGETFNGHLENCDAFMNLTLTEVYQTSNVSGAEGLNLSLLADSDPRRATHPLPDRRTVLEVA